MSLARVRIPKEVDTDELALVEELAILEAYKSFWAYRQWMWPDMKLGWWQREVARELQQFLKRMIAGERPCLVLMAPPQHGKSRQVNDFITWVVGHYPHFKTIYTSYADELGLSANLHLQRTFDNPRFKRVFDERIAQGGNSPITGRIIRNSGMLEFLGGGGSFRNTTVSGQITGQGLDLGLIDDPIKGREEAQSKTIRDKTWAWLTDDFFTRFSEHAALLMVMTRWHVDDPVGRFIEKFPEARVLRYPAIAETDERYRKKGEPLFPQHKSYEFLMMRKELQTTAGWESLYQQNPIEVGGGLFPIDKFGFVPVRPANHEITKSVRYWDKAGTAGGGAYSVGVLMHELKDGRVCVSDVRRGQWSALERETRIKQTAIMDREEMRIVETWVEQEPGSGGKESAERTIANLRGFIVKADRVTGDKETRAEPYAAQVQGGNVVLVTGDWNRAFLDEHEMFPGGRYKDQVDSAGGAFMKCTVRTYGSYDSSMSWVGGPGSER